MNMEMAEKVAAGTFHSLLWGAYWIAYMSVADLRPSWQGAAVLAVLAVIAGATWAYLNFTLFCRERHLKSQPDDAK